MSYQQVTLAQLQQRLSDRYEGVPFWSADEARRALNEGLRIWNAATGYWRAPFITVCPPGDPYVALVGTIVQDARVTFNGVPLEMGSLADFHWSLPNWRGTTTVTPGAPATPLYWARISLRTLILYPAPAFANAWPNQVIVDGVRNTPTLVNPADYVDLGQEEFNVLLAYAQHVLAFKIGGQTLVASYPGWLSFLKAAAARNQAFLASSFYRKLMGLDQQRREFPLITAEPTRIEAALPATGPQMPIARGF